ncbi:flavodoxin-dependent (E)-4-hydroxy-3-methylbut-2-enyl-diphosphate synthase, partial [bacterium]|nr:flavodoxin-dependent (E)-4-hydroxy-3-methylbut-2-enyl-diphosphate synthase [bacterium]
MSKRKTLTVKIGNVLMGSGHPIVVQSMTNTLTADVKKTVAQIKELADAGSELVRLTINDEAAMQAIPEIKTELLKFGCEVPLVGDFHYN